MILFLILKSLVKLEKQRFFQRFINTIQYNFKIKIQKLYLNDKYLFNKKVIENLKKLGYYYLIINYLRALKIEKKIIFNNF